MSSSGDLQVQNVRGKFVDYSYGGGNPIAYSYLGTGGNDTLTGGAGFDEFFYATGSGNDVIENVDDNDVVNLLGVSLSQITYASVEDSKISADFADGGHLEIKSSAAVGFKVEGVTYAANRADKTWYAK